jgi:hypothetical protein
MYSCYNCEWWDDIDNKCALCHYKNCKGLCDRFKPKQETKSEQKNIAEH